MVVPLVVNALAAEHAPVPIDPETFTTDAAVQVAVTAETGTVVHPLKVELAAATVTDHDRFVAPPLSWNATVAAELPATVPRSGSIALKLIVAGDAVNEGMLVAATWRTTEIGPS